MAKTKAAPNYPRSFFVLCWKCRARVYLQTEQSRPLMGSEMKCPTCGAPFEIKPGSRVKLSSTP